MASSASAKRLQDHVNNSLRRQNVPGADRCGPRWVQEAELGYLYYIIRLVVTCATSWIMSMPSIGTRHPALSGISTSNIERIQYITALCTTEIGALRLPRTSGPVPSKSKTALPDLASISMRKFNWWARSDRTTHVRRVCHIPATRRRDNLGLRVQVHVFRQSLSRDFVQIAPRCFGCAACTRVRLAVYTP